MSRNFSHRRSSTRAIAAVMTATLATAAWSAGAGATQARVRTSHTPRAAVRPAASRAPITVGFLNEQEGAVTFPDFGAGAQAARTYIDRHGGINGHRLEFLDCYTDGSPASSVACANRFVAAHVPAVLEGIDISSDSAVPVLAGAGIPLVGHTAFGTVQANSSDGFFFGAATGAYDVVPLAVMAKYLHVKSVTYLAEDNAQDRGFVQDDSVPAAKALGLKYDAIFYNAATPNYQATVASAIATGAQALFFTAPEPDCTSIVSTAATLGYKGYVFAGSCSAFIKADGQVANGVFTATDLYAPDDVKGVPAAEARQVRIYDGAMRSFAPSYVEGFAQDTFSSTMDLATVLRGIHGAATASSTLHALRRVTAMQSFMGQTLDCNGKQWPGERATCAGGLIEYRVESGRRVVFTHGFVDGESLVG